MALDGGEEYGPVAVESIEPFSPAFVKFSRTVTRPGEEPEHQSTIEVIATMNRGGKTLFVKLDVDNAGFVVTQLNEEQETALLKYVSAATTRPMITPATIVPQGIGVPKSSLVFP